jgi:hypothetical protein
VTAAAPVAVQLFEETNGTMFPSADHDASKAFAVSNPVFSTSFDAVYPGPMSPMSMRAC